MGGQQFDNILSKLKLPLVFALRDIAVYVAEVSDLKNRKVSENAHLEKEVRTVTNH